MVGTALLGVRSRELTEDILAVQNTISQQPFDQRTMALVGERLDQPDRFVGDRRRFHDSPQCYKPRGS